MNSTAETDSCPEVAFYTKMGQTLHAVSAEELLNARAEVLNGYHISLLQIAEGAAYSLAMVIRFALGHSARDGRVCVLARDSLSGWVALCCLRHLVNSGSTGLILHTADADTAGDNFKAQLDPLRALGVEEHVWTTKDQDNQMSTIIGSCHNLICGLFDHSLGEAERYADIVEVLNNLQTPVHCIEAPIGIDVDTGAKTTSPLYASSTLSLGLPLKGLFSGHDFVGRHYICDTSMPHSIFQRYTGSSEYIFSDQPVVQIFPKTEEPGQE